MVPTISKLKSGLTVMTIPNPNVETVNVMVLTRAGSRFEDDKVLGVAHFLEHMTFKGTIKRPSSIGLNREIELLGAKTNAFTWQEYTGYYISGNKVHLSKFLEILSDIYLNSTFPQEEMDKERGVIIEEIRMYQDDPKLRASHLFFNAAFPKSVLGRAILGSEDTIKGLKRQDFINFKKDNYFCKNTLVSISGNISSQEAFKIAGDYFGGYQNTGNEVKKVHIEKTGPSVVLEKRKTDQAHFRLGIKTDNLFSKQNPTIEVFSAICGEGMGSLMFELLREKMGAAYYAGASNISYTDTGVLMFSAGVTKFRLVESISELLKELTNIKDFGVSDELLKRAKEQIKGDLFMGLESTSGLNEYYAFDYLLKGKIEDPKIYAKKIDGVSVSQIVAFLKSNFKGENLSLAVVSEHTNEQVFYDLFKKI